ncbi:MAG: serine peptidase [Betaproteobacteria bacterium TMED156]|nr:MAG: serine peptidase [Betaproteobacteria bacterium TMED156]
MKIYIPAFFLFLNISIVTTINPFFNYALANDKAFPDFTELVEITSPAVVNIRTTQKNSSSSSRPPGFPQIPELDENDPMYEFFKRFFPPGRSPGQSPNQIPPNRGGSPRGQIPRGVGSGFIISPDGFVLSNHHVVSGADEVIVTLPDRREFSAEVIGSDQRTDVALLKIQGTNFPFLKSGNPSIIKVGEWVLAIGSPFGLENTVTAGIVSALGRDTGDYLPFIQTDVAVNPGNSGGPLLNLKGEVIGINSQIYSRTGGFMGISFAIPIDEANLVASQLRKTGRVIRGRIGVLIGEVTKDVADALGFPKPTGAVVRSVDPDGPSDPAGIKPGDIVLNFQGKKIQRVSDLPRIVGSTKPGTIAKIDLWRKGQVLSLAVKVDELKPREKIAQVQNPPSKPKTTSFDWLGLAVGDVPKNILNRLGLPGGVVISAVEGLAGRSGLFKGDIVVSINNNDISSVDQFSKVLAKLNRDKSVIFLIRRGGEALFIPIKP